MKYEQVPPLSQREIEIAVASDDRDRLPIAVLSAALFCPDREWAESICLQFATHTDPVVQGNAILGFGHIARRHRKLSKEMVKPLIENALVDPEEYVRGHADSAAVDVETFLKWQCQRPG
jgi:hypothetical protein